VLHHLADGVAATRTGTRIHAALLLAGQMVLALVVVGTFRSASRRSSNVVGLAGASGLVANLTANGVGSTWRWHTRVLHVLDLRSRLTARDRISRHAGLARTDGIVVHDLALGIVTARSAARILALLVYARPVLRALRTDHTLWLAARRSSNVALQAAAHRMTVGVQTLAVRSAG